MYYLAYKVVIVTNYIDWLFHTYSCLKHNVTTSYKFFGWRDVVLGIAFSIISFLCYVPFLYSPLFPGYYIFAEASSPRKQGDKAWISSPTYPSTKGKCVSFWYHMLGTGEVIFSYIFKLHKRWLVFSHYHNLLCCIIYLQPIEFCSIIQLNQL